MANETAEMGKKNQTFPAKPKPPRVGRVVTTTWKSTSHSNSAFVEDDGESRLIKAQGEVLRELRKSRRKARTPLTLQRVASILQEHNISIVESPLPGAQQDKYGNPINDNDSWILLDPITYHVESVWGDDGCQFKLKVVCSIFLRCQYQPSQK